MKKKFLAIIVLAITAERWCVADDVGPVEKPVPIWVLPRTHAQHTNLRMQLMDAIRRGDIKRMESVSRMGVSLIPGDAVWHYNLACALAWRENSSDALAELRKAVDFGFRDIKTMENDTDLKRISDKAGLNEVIAYAKTHSLDPVPGRPFIKAAEVNYGSTVTLSITNVAWNFDVGIFEAALRPNGANAVSPLAVNYKGPAQDVLTAWLSEGTASGNGRDLYVNLDRGHSRINRAAFPLLSEARLCREASAYDVDVNFPNMTYSDFAVFGNCSRALTQGPYWRSLPRAMLTESGLPARMDMLYRSNQFWVMPILNDYGKPELGDIMPGKVPFGMWSVGASYTDRPILETALAASAAFPRPTKDYLLKKKLLASTLQRLIRRYRPGVRNEAEYLTRAAHPTAFRSQDLGTADIVRAAHAMRPDEVPPVATVQMVNSKLFPIVFPIAGRDYPDSNGEVLYLTPTAVAIALRSPEGVRSFMFRAMAWPDADAKVEFAWAVVGGDPSKVKIDRPQGETLNGPSNGLAEITLDRRGLKGRIDIAVFAKTSKSEWGAPTFISFTAVPLEDRVYAADGKLESVDYSNPKRRYCDPHLALPRHWKDVYSYAADGKCSGYARYYDGKLAARFLPTGERISEYSSDGRPLKAVKVRYVPRNVVNNGIPELTYVDVGEEFSLEKK